MNYSLPEISPHEKIQDVEWIRIFLVDEDGVPYQELKIKWLAESGRGMGLEDAPEGTYHVCIEYHISDCDNKYWGYGTEITFIKREEDGLMIFYVTGKSIPIDFGILLNIKNGKNDALEIGEILGKYGLTELLHSPKDKKKNSWKFTGTWAYMVGMLLLCIALFIHYRVLDHIETGAIATPIIVQEIPANKGVIENIVQPGTFVKKGELLARVIDPSITSGLTILDDKEEEARKKVLLLQNEIAGKEIELTKKKAISEESHAFLQNRIGLEKEGFVSSSLVFVDRQKVAAEDLVIASIEQQIRQSKVELETLLKTWGNNFSKNDKQKGELQKQMKGSEFIAKCDCYVHSVDPDIRAIVIKLRPKDRLYIEAALPKDTVATMKDGQSVWFTTPGSDIYKKGKYKIVELLKNNRSGVSTEVFGGTKTSIIAIYPDEPIIGGEEIIGKPTALMLHTSSVSTTIERIKIYFTANF